ncbi:MAG: ABC transporter ATP-binding protein [Acidobacteriota bacterium]|jgi:NitT/TauT family transport system ATP-binding protein|nr:ABC transporter ATP-binding protein [Acidobacteriota bacterium]NLT32679.1 ABC transporter ATP-binding protein [Acidobacteriota bacterium]
MALIDARKVGKVYANRNGEPTAALEDFTLEVEANEFVGIVGPSGCGKTTFLMLVAGLETLTSGELFLEDQPVEGPDPRHAIVFQEFLLFPWRTVRQNVEFGPEVRGVSREKRRQIVDGYISLVGLEGFEDRYPHELSGGMRQKAAIARALANEPRVLLMDEPFASLDALTRETLQQELLRIWQQTEATVLFVTHSISEAVFLSDRVVVMGPRPGKIRGVARIGLPRPRKREILTSPEFMGYERHIRELVWDESQRN